MKVNLDYKLTAKEKEEIKISSQELTSNWITSGVASKYKDGLHGQLRRVWGRIQRKLDEAIDNDMEEIELEEAEKDFIKKVFSEDTSFPSGVAKIISVIEDEIESWGKDNKPEEEK